MCVCVKILNSEIIIEPLQKISSKDIFQSPCVSLTQFPPGVTSNVN